MIGQTKRYSVGIATGDGWVEHSDHTDEVAALTVAAGLRAQGVEARTFDWDGETPAGSLLDPDRS